MGPLRARVKSAKLPPTPYVYFPLVGGLHNPLGWAFSRYSNAKERVLYHGGVVATKVRYFGVKSTYTLADCGSTVALLPTVVFCSFGRDYSLLHTYPLTLHFAICTDPSLPGAPHPKPGQGLSGPIKLCRIATVVQDSDTAHRCAPLERRVTAATPRAAVGSLARPHGSPRRPRGSRPPS